LRDGEEYRVTYQPKSKQHSPKSGRYVSRPHKLSEEHRAAILKAKLAGQTLREIAGDFNVSHQTVANIVREQSAA
jgi:DNA-binding NarL/FixJ family response regulator